jgi:hypothetical protein
VSLRKDTLSHAYELLSDLDRPTRTTWSVTPSRPGPGVRDRSP